VGKIKIGKAPAHWPYAPPDQQFEGFKSMVEHSDMNIWEFENRMRTLVRAGVMSKARMYKLIKWFRHIKNISYSEYNSKRTKIKLVTRIPRGLWW